MDERHCVVAVVGAGYMAREHVRAFQDISGATVAAVHSRTKPRAVKMAEEFGIRSVCDTITELYQRSRADLVVVAVPELEANAVSRVCFQFPWTVLLEKPPGYDVADAEAIASVAEAKGMRVFVALNRRFYSSTRAVWADLEGLPGRRYIHVQDQEDQARALQAGQPELVVRNWMYANSIHIIDYLRFFGRGKVTRVQQVIPWDPAQPGAVVARIDFESGDIGLYEGIWDGPGPWAVSVTIPGKRWELRPLERAAFQLAGERRLEPVNAHPWDEAFKPGLRLQAELATQVARGGRSSLPTLQDAVETMHLIREIFMG